MRRWLTVAAILLSLGAAALWALKPRPLAVDLAEVRTGPLRGVLEVEGLTRVASPHAMTAPIYGMAQRSPVRPGDAVVAGQTVVAVIGPADPALMDARARAQAEAAVGEAEAALRLAEANLAQAEGELEHAARELERGKALAERGALSRTRLDDLAAAHDAADRRLRAATSSREVAEATLARMRAQLLVPAEGGGLAEGVDGCCLFLRAPVSGIVLDVAEESARPVQPGAPLLTVGDLGEMEVEVELLSSDAVRVQPGMLAEVDRWGGEGLLAAKVIRVAPAAETRLSALGIEEARVAVRLALQAPPETRPGLGHGYRVLVRLILWQEGAVQILPEAALFRADEGWAVFRLDGGIARAVAVTPGRRAGEEVEVLQGLSPGDRVVLYPPAELHAGDPVAPRD